MSTRQIRIIALISLFAFKTVDAQVPNDLELTSLGVSTSTIIAIRHANDGSNRLFLVERNGTIVIYKPGLGITGTFLDIETDVDTTFEGGLLGLAFHPDFPTNDYFYVYYTETGDNPNPLKTVVERFTVDQSDADAADLASRETIFTLDQPAANHNGGDIHFGPDGYLYIGLGDGGASSATAQNENNLLGKILRIAPCATEVCAQGYTVPGSNPNVGVAGADEIWSMGLRNPYRFSFDRQTGDLFIADVGQNTVEEVSFQAAANTGDDNYGWNCREGNIAGPGACAGTFVEPVMTYTHAGGNCSITGGYRYRGCIQGLREKYVFADYCSARIWYGTETSPGTWSITPWGNLSGNVFGFGEDESGELYLSQGSSVYRFESASDCLSDLIGFDGFEDPPPP